MSEWSPLYKANLLELYLPLIGLITLAFLLSRASWARWVRRFCLVGLLILLVIICFTSLDYYASGGLLYLLYALIYLPIATKFMEGRRIAPKILLGLLSIALTFAATSVLLAFMIPIKWLIFGDS